MSAPVDISKIKPGDEVLVRCIAGFTGTDCPSGRPWAEVRTADASPSTFRAFAEAIVSHTPRALAVGDRVRFCTNPNSVRGEIRAIDGSRAWVYWHGSSEFYHNTEVLSNLERVDE